MKMQDPPPSGRHGRPRDPNAMRTPSGAKSRSRRAKLVEALNTPTAQKRIADNRRLGVDPQAAVETALDRRASTSVNRLHQLGVISAKQCRAARMLADAMPPAPLRTQATRFDEGMRYGTRITAGRMVAAHADLDAGEDDDGRHVGEPGYTPSGHLVGGTTFQNLMDEYLRDGMTPRVAASIAREAVIEEHGPDAWRLVLAVVSGTVLPPKSTKAMLRAALDTVSATLGTEFGSKIGMTAHELHLHCMGPALLASEYRLRPIEDPETEIWLMTRGRRTALHRLEGIDLRFLPIRPFNNPWSATAIQF